MNKLQDILVNAIPIGFALVATIAFFSGDQWTGMALIGLSFLSSATYTLWKIQDRLFSENRIKATHIVNDN